jgi:TonB family protein
MTQLGAAAAFLLCISHFLVAGTDPAAQQLLTTAKQQVSLFQEGTTPFQLDVDFSAQMTIPAQGHLRLKWQSPHRWWRHVALAQFEQIDVRNGDKLYTARNASFTPVRVSELFDLLQFAEHSDDWKVKKQKQRFENGLAITCLQVKSEKQRNSSHDVCIDPAGHDILSDEWGELPDERRRQQYGQYAGFGPHRYPRKFTLFVNGSKAIDADVLNLASATIDETLFVPPKGAIERRQCEGMQHPVPIHTPDPTYPKSASQNKLMGDTTVSLTVLADGSVTNIQVIGSAVRSMDEETVQTLSKWKFKPAMCGTEPVVSDIEVTVSFRLEN